MAAGLQSETQDDLLAAQSAGRSQRLQRRRLNYAHARLRDLQRICPHVTEELIAQHGLHQISWSVRRAGKSAQQRCLLRSTAAQTGGSLEKHTVPDDALRRAGGADALRRAEHPDAHVAPRGERVAQRVAPVH